MASETDVRGMFDRSTLGAWDVAGKDWTLIIDRVERGTLNNGKTKSKKPLVFFRKTKLPLALNKTMMKVVAGMYGYDTRDWAGKAVTLYATTTQFGTDTVDCIRIKPAVPRARAAQPDGDQLPDRPVDEEMRRKQEAARDKVEGETDKQRAERAQFEREQAEAEQALGGSSDAH